MKEWDPVDEHFPRFASRHSPPPTANRLTQALRLARRGQIPILDLCVGNPGQAALELPLEEFEANWLNALRIPYQPDPRGWEEARAALAAYYREQRRPVTPEQVLLTSSTSEAYSFCFQLFCEAGDEVLVPRPSYPLLEELCELAHLQPRHYSLQPTGRGWVLPDSFPTGGKTRVLLVVNPNNPTGSILGRRNWKEIERFCQESRLLLLCDEVFSDYVFARDSTMALAAQLEIPRITLNGISKVAGLPQLKLGWMLVEGPETFVAETLGRLEIIADNYLSVNTPIQICLPEILRKRQLFQEPIRERLQENRHQAARLLAQSPAEFFEPEAGWSAVIRLPRIRSDEEWALDLLQEDHLLVYPGYLFGFEGEGYIVVSLLTPPQTFAQGVRRLRDRVGGL